MERIKSLDGLRGFAVLLVLLSHASLEGIRLSQWLDFEGMGQSGVYLFFILSAYLLDTQILINCVNKTNFLYWKNYFLRRILRIYPLYILTLLLFYFINHFNIAVTTIGSFNEVLEHIALIKGEGIFWTIAVEFKYYLLSPILILISLRFFNNRLVVLGFYVVVMLLSYLITWYFELDKTATIKYLPIFLIGTILSFYKVGTFGELVLPKWLTKVCVGLIILTIPKLFFNLFGVSHDLFGWPGFGIYTLIWGIILFELITDESSTLSKVFRFQPLRFLGKISFSAYLLHIPILGAINKIDFLTPSIQLLLFLILTIIVSYMSFNMLEKPLSKIRISK